MLMSPLKAAASLIPRVGRRAGTAAAAPRRAAVPSYPSTREATAS